MIFLRIVISYSLKFFTDQILKTYPHLKVEYDPNQPCIFFGVYDEIDAKNLTNHKSYGLIIWGGTDVTSKAALSFVKTLDKTRFFSIAQSKWIANDLRKNRIPHKQLPWYSLDKKNFKPVKKGKKIYMYMPTFRKDFYGYSTYMAIKDQINYEIIIGDGKIPYEKMAEIYSECFLGLRLVSHDGLGSTVQELGLMGIKCIHNGNSPSALNYQSNQDIINHINNEAKTIGTIDIQMAKKVNDYLNINSSFFKVNTWFNTRKLRNIRFGKMW